MESRVPPLVRLLLWAVGRDGHQSWQASPQMARVFRSVVKWSN